MRAGGTWRRFTVALTILLTVIAVGTVGYIAFGFTVLEALFQTVTTVSTVGFREVRPLGPAEQVFTIGVIFAGVGAALYTFSALTETLVEGQMANVFGRRRMEKRINELADHVVVCGWGRVGRAIARYVAGSTGIVIVDNDGDRLADCPHPYVVGDATEDGVLRAAGIERARALVAAINTDAENLYVTLSGRTLNPALFIVARARLAESEDKFLRAGADRVVNPQAIGGSRMAAFIVQPHVAEFLDVVMHDGTLEFRLEEVPVPDASPLAGTSLRQAHIRDRTGALVLAMRDRHGRFTTNPAPETIIEEGQILIAVGTAQQLAELSRAVKS